MVNHAAAQAAHTHSQTRARAHTHTHTHGQLLPPELRDDLQRRWAFYGLCFLVAVYVVQKVSLLRPLRLLRPLVSSLWPSISFLHPCSISVLLVPCPRSCPCSMTRDGRLVPQVVSLFQR